MSIRVKVCGITNQEDALCAVRCHVDALGFVFYQQSKRYITPLAAAHIITTVPPFVTPVGLFVNAPADEVFAALAVMPTLVPQFHGDESERFCAQFNRPYIKAVRVQSADDITRAEHMHPSASALLLDAYVAGAFGGTGQSFDWAVIPKIHTPLIIAGGLRPEKIANVLKTIRPYALDVSSGVEREPRKKDAQLMQSFMAEVAKY